MLASAPARSCPQLQPPGRERFPARPGDADQPAADDEPVTLQPAERGVKEPARRRASELTLVGGPALDRREDEGVDDLGLHRPRVAGPPRKYAMVGE
jgi:hypothetical protein